MPARLQRIYGRGHLHFITFSCYQAGGADVSVERFSGAAPFGFKGAVLELSYLSRALAPYLRFLRGDRSAVVPVLPWRSTTSCSTASLSGASPVFSSPDSRACTPVFPALSSRSIR